MSSALPGSVAPLDTVIGPIVAQLGLVAGQIAGIGRIYLQPPDSTPEDNSVLIPCKSWRFLDPTNGRLRIELTFEVIHLFTRRQFDEAIPDMQTFVPAWWTVFGDWNNQTLGNTARSFSVESGQITTIRFGSDTYFALVHKLRVLASDFLVVTQPH